MNLKIKSVEIKNFKSIREAFIPFGNYGEGLMKSKTTFLVGVNETGKSAILEALSLISTELDEVDYEDCCYKPAYDENEDIDIHADLEVEDPKYWVNKMKELGEFPPQLCEKIRFIGIRRTIYTDMDRSGSFFSVVIADIDLSEYIIETGIIINADGNKVEIPEIKLISELTSIEKTAVLLNLKENQKPLTKDYLEKVLGQELASSFEGGLPKIQIWRPSAEYLINHKVDLSEFKENPSVSLPLKNMFHIYGKIKNEEIKTTIERALTKQEKCDELKDKMSEAVTKHLNKIWKEHKVKVVVSINGNDCQVFVEDKDKKHTYYKMNQRSDGFKQFVSLMLSLSALNDSDSLKNNIILIDEPEVHLHPSGVKYMRDEILKIGKNNQVFVSTHSHYMVDTNCPERHWVVRKEKSETNITQIDENTPIEDDAVLASAFGLSLFKQLLPENIIIVEGSEDKEILLHVLNRTQKRFFYSVKSAGGASKMPGIATLLSNERVSAFMLFDDDKEGSDNKKKILENSKESFNLKNVFTLRDVDTSLPNGATLEDLMPTDFVKGFFESELKVKFDVTSSSGIIFQIKKQSELLKEKQKLDSLKIKLSKKFIEDFHTDEKIQSDAPLVSNFVRLFVDKIESAEL